MILYIAASIAGSLGIICIYLSYSRIKLKIQLDFTIQQLNDLKIENQTHEAEKINNIHQIEQLSGQLKYQEHLIEEFNKLKAESNESAKAVLFDLGNQLSQQLIEIHKKENLESRNLTEKNIKETTSKFNQEFERIVSIVGSLNKEVTQSKDTVDIIKNALLSPSGAGSLAEITLENILKSSGLRTKLDFIMQYNINSEGEQSSLRPDAIIFLPNERLMIVDAKASKFLVDDQDNLKNLAKTMNMHLKSLSSKNYADSLKKDMNGKQIFLTNIVTLMFVPSEHAIEKIMKADNDFMHKAWKSNIFPVGPSGLMNILSFAKFQISEQMMIHNHLQIIEEVKKLISSVGTMTEHSLKLGNSISNAVNHYDKFAASFNSNFLSKARKLSSMGIEGGLKKNQESLKRLQLFISKSDLIEVDPETEIKKLIDSD